MRKNSLRQTANRYLHTDNRGSHQDKKQRTYVIHKMIDDLFTLGKVPEKWQLLTIEHLKELVRHWHKQKLKPATMIKYMTVIRIFLHDIGHDGVTTDNRDLGIARKAYKRKTFNIAADVWNQSKDPIARVVLGLQIHFGLTQAEALRLTPDIHIQEHALWLTREITFNSLDRLVPLRTETQMNILDEIKRITPGDKSFISTYGFESVRLTLRQELQKLNLPPLKSYRHLYARQLQYQLGAILGHYQLSLLIMDELGLRSRTTLWSYLHE